VGDKWQRSFLLQQVIQENYEVRSFRFEFGLSRFDFLPGQFSVVCPQSRPDLRASLTFSSAPQEDTFEFTLKRSGDFGTHFYDAARPGDVVRLTQAAGGVALQPDHLGSPLCMLVRDYCMPAARSFLRWLDTRPPGHRLTLVHELSHPRERLFGAELEQFQARQRLSYVPLPEGEVSQPLLDGLFPSGSNPYFYIYGEAADARRFRDLLQQRGVSKERMLVERWS
jgi:ferredoxin-NADP reductase